MNESSQRVVYSISSKALGCTLYIGCTSMYKSRVKAHKYSLLGNYHFNTLLQEHFNCFGSDDLIFDRLREGYGRWSVFLREEIRLIKELNPVCNIKNHLI